MAIVHLVWIVSVVSISVVTAQLLTIPKQQTCYEDSDCAGNECCGRITGPLLVSKRLDHPIQGTCKRYLQADENCWGYWTQNGACGCAPTLICKYFPPLKIQPIKTLGKRRPAPGKHVCKPRV